MSQFPKISFVALETYSLVGGLQQFNRRVISALAHLSQKNNALRPTVILKGDYLKDIGHVEDNALFIPCGNSRLNIVKQVIKASRHSEVMFFGHINLLPMVLIAKLINPKIKTILFVHGDDVWGDPVYRSKKRWEPIALNWVDQVASVSQYTADRMAQAYDVDKGKFLIFPNAIDPIIENSIESNSIAQKTIITVARLAAHDWGKHVDSVLHAMPEILSQVNDVKYYIVGDGMIVPKLKQLAIDLEVDHAVEFTGRVTDQELQEMYQQADIFVMPSEKEGFGIVFLEAWQRKVPVICGSEDASHEVITNGIDGYAVHHNDIITLSDKIIYLLTHPEIATKMGMEGYKKVEQKYLMANFIENMENLIENICLKR